MKERELPTETLIKLYHLAGERPNLAKRLAKRQHLEGYPVEEMQNHYERTAQTLERLLLATEKRKEV